MENLNLRNPDYENIPNKYLDYVKSFVDSGILKEMINYYQEYEFIYKEQGILYHGVIDLVVEYDDRMLIIDYKLKNTIDNAYKNQLIGYKKYLSQLTDKPINILLYSFIDKRFEEVFDE